MDACKLPLLQNELHFLRPTVLRGFDFLASWIGLENKNDAASVFPRGDLLKSCDFTAEERRPGLLLMKEDLSSFEGLGFGFRDYPVSALKQI